MMTLADLIESRVIFDSEIWTAVVTKVRDALDVKESDTYITNIIDDTILEQFGDWELQPKFVDDDDTPKDTLITRTVNRVIGLYSELWSRLVDTITMTRVSEDFSPLWNVDEHTAEKTTYGQHETENYSDEKVQTNSHGEQVRTYEKEDHATEFDYAKHETSTEQDPYSVGQAIGTRTDTHSETTMDNTSTLKLKTQDTTAVANQITIDNIQFQDGTYTQKQKTKFEDKAHKDTTTAKAYTDTDTYETYDDTITNDPYTDKTTSKKHEDEFTRRRYGNIGTTMTGQLVEDWLSINTQIAGIIAQEIAKHLAFAIWY